MNSLCERAETYLRMQWWVAVFMLRRVCAFIHLQWLPQQQVPWNGFRLCRNAFFIFSAAWREPGAQRRDKL